LQNRGNGVNRGTTNQFPEGTRSLKALHLYIGSMLFLNKTAPSPVFRTNLYTDYDIFTGRINIPENIKRICTKLDVVLQGVIENDHIESFDVEDELE